MRLAGLVESINHVCCRYRLAAFATALEAAGHSLELIALPRSPWRRWRLARSLGRFDAVILQRKLLSRWEISLIRRYAARLLFDVDDAVWLRDSYAPKGFHSPRRLRRFSATVRACDAVVCGNTFLATNSDHHARPGRAYVIPTCVDPARYPAARHARSAGSAELVWVGSSSTLHGLESVRPMLETLGRALPGIRLKLICDRFLTLEHLPIIACPWAETTEAVDIAAADVGISWIPDDPWSRGKCGLKVLQYMAAGLPVVANPVGVHPEMVRPGETGFLAATPDEWVRAVRTLADDPALRQRMGTAARRLVETTYSVSAGARGWNDVLAALAQRRVSA